VETNQRSADEPTLGLHSFFPRDSDGALATLDTLRELYPKHLADEASQLMQQIHVTVEDARSTLEFLERGLHTTRTRPPSRRLAVYHDTVRSHLNRPTFEDRSFHFFAHGLDA
jgi:hypothetical protein